ncbi:UNVERIFIED_CONTAM: Inositol phosphorylceramide glucuronosyltransferase 1, partial [Sesamum angustifolium]
MVALVSDGVSNYAKKLLQADGWIVKTISLLENPNQVRPTRFWGVYTKLKIFNMTDYKKVVYLDADTIVVKNIEDLFKCQKFCANLKHSERLNSGVMVVEPSEEVFKDMMTKVNTMYSYTGGDQGFLNSYFPDFANARIFDPYASAEELKSRPIPQMERLSTLYNADVGLYMLANKVTSLCLFCIFCGYPPVRRRGCYCSSKHYDGLGGWLMRQNFVLFITTGPLKPWDWWTHWLVKPVDVWQNARIKLDETLPGTGGGQNPKDKLLITFLILLPLVFLMFCYYRSYLQLPNAANKVPVFLGAMSVVVCIMAALFSLALSFSIVPRQVMPWTGHLREMSSCDVAACYYGLGMASLALAVLILGVTALFV